MDEKSLKSLHGQSIHHRAAILASNECGCFYCGAIFAPVQIGHWVDDGQTATCPCCGIDAVLPDSPTPEVLADMKLYWF